eukprot:jgi/Psemu1/311606/fgenesh1_kg.796_\
MLVRRKFDRRLGSSPSREPMVPEDYFGIPPERTMFGVKKTENWDSFQSRYSDTKITKQNFHTKTKRDADTKAEQRGNRRRGIKHTLWAFLNCLLIRSQKKRRRTKIGDDSFERGDDDEWIKKTIPFIERYSDYFERRKTNFC